MGIVGLGLILYLNVRPEPPIDGVVQLAGNILIFGKIVVFMMSQLSQEM
ncbi:MAG: hypothetical protein GY805_10780 [Chloroflexi bacterium]|nr:hypothetical protein [Chloroflexota bacterium]